MLPQDKVRLVLNFDVCSPAHILGAIDHHSKGKTMGQSLAKEKGIELGGDFFTNIQRPETRLAICRIGHNNGKMTAPGLLGCADANRIFP